jgi:NAD(P)-dependent dehydrogenase (short-subunit alcohol dehydrogenase family)
MSMKHSGSLTALVTGANRGIGLATARALGQRGIQVWLGARSDVAGSEAARRLRLEGIHARFVRLDVCDAASIHGAAQELGAASSSLDILVNNAGIMRELNTAQFTAVAASRVPVATIQHIHETNFLGAVATIQAMLPLLRQAPAARIVNVSSRLGSIGMQSDPSWPHRAINQLGYASSKAALNMATALFAYELRETTIKINAVSPGTIATDLSGTPAKELAGRPGFGTPEEGAAVIVRYALPDYDGPSGRFFGPDGELPW